MSSGLYSRATGNKKNKLRRGGDHRSHSLAQKNETLLNIVQSQLAELKSQVMQDNNKHNKEIEANRESMEQRFTEVQDFI